MGGEVVSGRGRHYRWVGLVGGRVETQSFEIVSLPEPRRRRALSVTVVAAKKGSLEQNCEGSKVKRDDK